MTENDEKDWIQRIDQRMMAWFWRRERPRQGPKAWLFVSAQVLHLAVRNSITDRLTFSANALTFMTLLGLVPALAISFSLAKGLGFASALRKLLLSSEFLLSQKEIFQQMLSYVERTSVATLGAVGFAALVVTIVLALSNVEEVFNRIWEVRTPRTLLRRFTDYTAVLVICPLLGLTAAASWATFSSHRLVQWALKAEVVGPVAETGMALGPFALLVMAFIFFYLFLPNTRVPLLPVVLGGVIAAALWWMVQNIYIVFQVGVTRYNAIYGGFASLPLFMIWLHVSWVVVLFGAELAHAYQVCLRGPLPSAVLPPVSPAQKEALALRIYLRLARAFHAGTAPYSLSRLSDELGAPLNKVAQVVRVLIDSGLVTPTATPDVVQPGRSLHKVTPADIWEAMRGAPVNPSDHSCTGQETSLIQLLRDADCDARCDLVKKNFLELVNDQETDPCAGICS